MIRPLRALLAAVLLVQAVPLLLVLTAPPVHACSCAFAGARQYAAWADAVFVATLAEPLHARRDGVLEARAVVDTFYRGEVAEEVVVTTASQGSACGLTRLADGGTWLFFGTDGRGDAGYWVGQCGGSRPVGPEGVPRVEAVLGPGRAVGPTRVPSDPPTSSASPAGAAGHAALDRPDAAGGGTTAATAGVAVASVVGLGLVAVVLLGSRRRRRT